MRKTFCAATFILCSIIFPPLTFEINCRELMAQAEGESAGKTQGAQQSAGKQDLLHW
jgi:hypothetical protein